MQIWKNKWFQGIGSIVLGLVGAVLLSWQTGNAEVMQRNLSKEILRFHVIANSDTQVDQELKLKVRDEVLAYLDRELGTEADFGETKEFIQSHLTEITQVSDQVILDQGFDYETEAQLEVSYFPEKTYGDLTFPKGNYEALRIQIGNATGQNWWCVLYPALCFMDGVTAVVPEEGKEKLHGVLSPEEYDMLEEKPVVRFKFKYLTFLN